MTWSLCQHYDIFMIVVGGQMVHDPEQNKEGLDRCYPDEYKPYLQKLEESKTLQNFGTPGGVYTEATFYIICIVVSNFLSPSARFTVTIRSKATCSILLPN